MWGDPNRTKRRVCIAKKAVRRIGGVGDPMASISIHKGRGILRFLKNAQGLVQFSFQENRQGIFLGFYVKRPGFEKNIKSNYPLIKIIEH